MDSSFFNGFGKLKFNQMILLNFENYFPTETRNSLESRKAFLSKVEKTRCTLILINDMAIGLFKYKKF